MALSENEINDVKTILKRNPTDLEYFIFDTMWSEHCSYKSSKSVLKQLPTKADSVALGIGEDAGIIRFVRLTINNIALLYRMSLIIIHHKFYLLKVQLPEWAGVLEMCIVWELMLLEY